MNPEKVLEHLKCPICMEIPPAKVFQCRNGHIQCESCYSRLSNCPQCRQPFDTEPIRSLWAETTLDALKWECPYTNSGCVYQINRTSFERHVKRCSNNIERFGAFVNLCGKVGFQDCSFQANKGNVADSIQHFQSCHDIPITDGDKATIHLENYSSRVPGDRKRFILARKEEGYAFFIVLRVSSGKNKCILVKAFYWMRTKKYVSGSSEQLVPYQVECSIKGSNYDLKWRVLPIDIFKRESGEKSCKSLPKNMSVSESGTLYIIVKLIKST